MAKLTAEDWTEIYYALDYKLTSPAVGSDREGKRWRAHLKRILKTIGPDGESMANAPEPQVIIVLDGGIVQEVLSSEEAEIAVIDYDTQDLETATLTDIPQGDGKTEKAYVALNYPSVMPERTAKLLAIVRENVT